MGTMVEVNAVDGDGVIRFLRGGRQGNQARDFSTANGREGTRMKRFLE
jgi:hypothetical protein